MLKQNRTKNLVTKVSFDLKQTIFECKWRLLITLMLCLLSIALGIFFAIKLKNEDQLSNAVNYGFVDFSVVSLNSFSSFLMRILSAVIFTFLIFLFSTSVFLYPLAEIILMYKGYLLGLNICIILLTGGFSGFFVSIFIIFPCQLLGLIIFALFFSLFSKKSCDMGKKKILLFVLLALFFVGVVESILLLIFNTKIILVL